MRKKYSLCFSGILPKGGGLNLEKKPNISTKQFSHTDVGEVKKLNAQSGLSYNEVFALLGERYVQRKNQD